MEEAKVEVAWVEEARGAEMRAAKRAPGPAPPRGVSSAKAAPEDELRRRRRAAPRCLCRRPPASRSATVHALEEPARRRLPDN